MANKSNTTRLVTMAFLIALEIVLTQVLFHQHADTCG